MNKVFLAILIIAVLGLFHLLAPILTPFLLAGLLAYLVDPIVVALMRFGMPRLLAVVLVFLSLFLIILMFILFLIPLIEDQLVLLGEYIPRVISWVQKTVFPWLQAHFGINETFDAKTIKNNLGENLAKAGGAASWLLKTILHSGFALVAILTNLILIPVVTFYLLRDWDRLIAGTRKLLPRRIEPTVVHLTKQSDEVLSAFFRGQLLVMLSLGIIYSVGLMLVGLQLSLVIGLFAGIAAIVPFLGFIVGITTASIAAFIQFGTSSSVLLVCLVFLVGQAMESMVLTPKLVGHRIGLHPVAVIFAVLAGGTLFGFFGVLLALPVAAVLMVMIRFANRHYLKSHFYK